MPTRGYRKGISDDKSPSPRRIHTRLPDDVHAALLADADSRSTPASSIIRALLTAHYRGHRAELPQPQRVSDAFLHEYARLGNNLNQIARQANQMRLHLLEHDVRACLAALHVQAKQSIH